MDRRGEVIESVVKLDDGCYSIVTLAMPLCISCGFPIGNVEMEYNRLILNQPALEVFEKLGIKRVCCRTRLSLKNYYRKIIDREEEEVQKILIDNFDVTVKPRFYPEA